MFRYLVVLASAAALSGCITVGEFLGSSDPCAAANNIHSSFLVAVAAKPRLAEFRDEERAGYVAIREYCSTGDVRKPTLQRLVGAYAAAIADYKRAAR